MWRLLVSVLHFCLLVTKLRIQTRSYVPVSSLTVSHCSCFVVIFNPHWCHATHGGWWQLRECRRRYSPVHFPTHFLYSLSFSVGEKAGRRPKGQESTASSSTLSRFAEAFLSIPLNQGTGIWNSRNAKYRREQITINHLLVGTYNSPSLRYTGSR